jgi:hypothetical protein
VRIGLKQRIGIHDTGDAWRIILENGYRVLSGGSGMTDSRVSEGCTTQPWPKLAQYCGPA